MVVAFLVFRIHPFPLPVEALAQVEAAQVGEFKDFGGYFAEAAIAQVEEIALLFPAFLEKFFCLLVFHAGGVPGLAMNVSPHATVHDVFLPLRHKNTKTALRSWCFRDKDVLPVPMYSSMVSPLREGIKIAFHGNIFPESGRILTHNAFPALL